MVVKVGRVPGTVIDLAIAGEKPLTVFEVLTLAAKEIQRLQGRPEPPFLPSRVEYKDAGGKKMIDVPFLNGKPLATKKGDRWEKVQWDTPVSDGDIVLLIPKIQGNQIIVKVGQVPGASAEYAIETDDAGTGEGQGTVRAALEAAGLSPDMGRTYVDGNTAKEDYVLSDGEEVVLFTGFYTAEELALLDSDELIALVLEFQNNK